MFPSTTEANTPPPSLELALYYSASSTTGIDKDPSLIQQAQSHISFLYSRLKPSSPADQQRPDADTDAADTRNYFPISSVLDHGHRRRPDPPSLWDGDSASPPGFPFNVSFLTEDWSSPLPPPASPPEPRQTYDVLLALSVLKWIHIRARDDGVTSFLQRCHGSLVPGGRLVLEIQPWTSYEKAVKKMKKKMKNKEEEEKSGAAEAGDPSDVLGTLKVRPEGFGVLLEELGFWREKVLEGEGLPRRIEVWRKG